VRDLGEKRPASTCSRPIPRLGLPPARVSVKLNDRVKPDSGAGQCTQGAIPAADKTAKDMPDF
jgi:hypothetical protein